jgi:hypothetical protein
MGKEISETQLLTYITYSQISESLQHYNNIQVTYRTFASSWLLASFIGMIYSLSSREVNLPFHPLITVAFICLASITGIVLIWYMDLIITERSIAAFVYDGVELEKKYLWLPRFYTNNSSFSGLVSYIHLKGIFYIGCVSTLLFMMGAALSFYKYLSHWGLWPVIPFITLVITFLVAYCLVLAMGKTDPYVRIETLKRKKLV